MESLLYQISCPESEREACLALLGQWPFYAFEADEQGWKAYLFQKEKTAGMDAALRSCMDERGWTLKTVAQPLPKENWNARWEASFQPVRIGDFCGIRAAFHPPFEPPVLHELIIQPKMAFGTGHHETTYMMVELMQYLPLQGARVFDYGCGTGVLAILSAKLGAEEIYAIDIEEAACENTPENAAINGLKKGKIRVRQGDLSVLGETGFDFVLANINRGVILASLPQMKSLLKPAGRLLISGFLREDEALMLSETQKVGFKLLRRAQKGAWLAFELGAKC